MSLGENLQYLRQKRGLTQEQIAEQLQVSRQSVSKWESGSSYPEMDKILQLCDIFQCTMDTLVKQDAREVCAEDDSQYDLHMNQYSKAMAFGIGLLLSGVAFYEFLAGVGIAENINDMLFWVIIVVSVMVFIVFGMRDSDFRRKYREVSNIYSEREIDEFHKIYINLIAVGVGLILVGVIFEGFVDGIQPPADFTEDIYHSVFMLFVAAGVTIMTYAGIQKKKYNIDTYNRQNSLSEERRGRASLKGKICSTIMIIATIIFLLTGFVWNSWGVAWIIYPIGGLLCGIAAILLSRE